MTYHFLINILYSVGVFFSLKRCWMAHYIALSDEADWTFYNFHVHSSVTAEDQNLAFKPVCHTVGFNWSNLCWKTHLALLQERVPKVKEISFTVQKIVIILYNSTLNNMGFRLLLHTMQWINWEYWMWATEKSHATTEYNALIQKHVLCWSHNAGECQRWLTIAGLLDCTVNETLTDCTCIPTFLLCLNAMTNHPHTQARSLCSHSLVLSLCNQLMHDPFLWAAAKYHGNCCHGNRWYPGIVRKV